MHILRLTERLGRCPEQRGAGITARMPAGMVSKPRKAMKADKPTAIWL